jgi:hypothetical protein
MAYLYRKTRSPFWYVVYFDADKKEVHRSTGLRADNPNDTAILIVSTGELTPSAVKYRAHITQKTPLNMIVIDGHALDEIVKDPSAIGGILESQARDAMKLKEQLIPLQTNQLPIKP